MAVSKFTPEIRDGLVELFADGFTIADACRTLEVREKTVKGWITRGNKEADTAYAEFAARVREARLDAAEVEEPMDLDELKLEVSKSAKKGSVQAMKLFWEMIRAPNGGEDDGDEKPEGFEALDDELEPRRAQRAGV